MNNFTNMTSFRLNKALFVVLITAFLAMQWSTAHIHLAKHHGHDGSHHQHNIAAHAHQLIDRHDDSIDSSHQIDNGTITVVDVDCECNSQSGKKFDEQPVTIAQTGLKLSSLSQTGSIESSEFGTSKQRYLDYSTIHLRAPPKLS